MFEEFPLTKDWIQKKQNIKSTGSIRNEKKKSWPITGLGTRRPLKILNGTKLILDDHMNHLDSFRIYFESFRSFRGTLFPKTGQDFFFYLLGMTSRFYLLNSLKTGQKLTTSFSAVCIALLQTGKNPFYLTTSQNCCHAIIGGPFSWYHSVATDANTAETSKLDRRCFEYL